MLKKICQYSGCDCFAVEHHTYCEKHLLESQKKHQEWLKNHSKKKPFENAERTNNYNNASLPVFGINSGKKGIFAEIMRKFLQSKIQF